MCILWLKLLYSVCKVPLFKSETMVETCLENLGMIQESSNAERYIFRWLHRPRQHNSLWILNPSTLRHRSHLEALAGIAATMRRGDVLASF